jgi:hypothetical protein
MQKLVTLNPSTSPDNVLTFDIVTGEVQYSPKANIATPTTVTLTQATGKTIAKINNTEIKETITDLGKPTLAGNILSIPFTNENGIVKTETVDLSSILAGLGQSTTTYNPATKKIKITKPDATFVEIDLSDLIDPNQVTDGISLKGTGTVADPFRIDFATRAMLDIGTDTTHAINVLELKNQIQTNQYKKGKVTTIPHLYDGQSQINITLDYPITKLKAGERFFITSKITNNGTTSTYDSATNQDYLSDDMYQIEIKDLTGAYPIFNLRQEGIKPNQPFTIVVNDTEDGFYAQDIDPVPLPIIPQSSTSYLQSSNGGVRISAGGNSTEAIATNSKLIFSTTMVDTDNIVIGKGTGTNVQNQKISLLDFKKLIQPKKFYSASTPLIVGETTITHNLGLVAPFDFLSDFRDPITGASVGLRIKVGSKTANSFIVISNIATAVEITARA